MTSACHIRRMIRITLQGIIPSHIQIVMIIHHSRCSMLHNLTFYICLILLHVNFISIFQMSHIIPIGILFIHTLLNRICRLTIRDFGFIDRSDPLRQTP